jgi:hypothetical protein
MRISDIRPAMMLQLARLPGHNYATSCAGFIDSEFESYVSKYSNAGPSNSYVAFPNATTPNQAIYETEYEIQNPYQIKNRTWNGEEWEKEKKERIRELNELQAQNGANDIKLARADFPTTIDDLSFSERMELNAAGYEPWKDADAYQQIKIEKEEDYLNRTRNMYQYSSNNDPNSTRVVLSYKIK